MTAIVPFLLGAGRRHPGAAIHVGLVNNMPDAAMRATELQFARLLKEAAGPLDVRLRLFSLGAIARGEAARSRMAGFYDDAGFLPASQIDALIVTGAQPSSDDLRGEPYWPELAHLIDWAEIGTISTLFSCLAAHAAVLHLDGIARRPLPRKLSGVFASARMLDDPLLLGLPSSLSVPHSRRNDIAAADLAAKGYRLLSRLENGQADIFTRGLPGHSHFVFLQGHPEYDAGTLGREYLRDMGRFLQGEAPAPHLPEQYFDPATEARLARIPLGDGALEAMGNIIAQAMPRRAWRAGTVRMFANWLTLVAAGKARRVTSRAIHTRKRA